MNRSLPRRASHTTNTRMSPKSQRSGRPQHKATASSPSSSSSSSTRLTQRKSSGGKTLAAAATRWQGGLRGAVAAKDVHKKDDAVIDQPSDEEQTDANVVPMESKAPQKAILSAEDIRRYREACTDIETRIRARNAITVWREKTIAGRFSGPHAVPKHTGESVEKLHALQESAEGAVVAFLLACLRRTEDRKSGNDLMMLTLHPSNLIDQDGTGMTIRKHVFKFLHTLRRNALASYITGANAENDFSYNRQSVTFQFDRLTPGYTLTQKSTPNGVTAKLYVVTSAAIPPSRPIQVTKCGGRWLVSDFKALAIQIQRRTDSPEADNDTTATASDAAANGVDGVSDRGHVPGMIRVFDMHGKVTGYVPAVNFQRIKRIRARERPESANSRRTRHERAKTLTMRFALLRANDEMLRRWEAEPQTARRLVAANGIVEDLAPMTLQKVQDLRQCAPLQPGHVSKTSGILPPIHRKA